MKYNNNFTNKLVHDEFLLQTVMHTLLLGAIFAALCFNGNNASNDISEIIAKIDAMDERLAAVERHQSKRLISNVNNSMFFAPSYPVTVFDSLRKQITFINPYIRVFIILVKLDQLNKIKFSKN